MRDLACAFAEEMGGAGDRGGETGPLVVPGVDLGRALRVAVINNPHSWRNARRETHKAIHATLAAHPRSEHFEESSFDGMLARTQDLVRQGVELLVINGGDGTVQAVLTGLFNLPAHTRQPLLAVLAGGTTNTTAHSVGYGKGRVADLDAVLCQAEAGCLQGTLLPHAVMRVEFGQPLPMYAMFFGAGGVFHGTNLYRQEVESRGLRGEIGGGLALAIFVGKVLSGKAGAMFPPLRMTARLDQRRLSGDDYFGVLISTMERQFLGIRPYWGVGPGPVRFSALSHRPRHLLRAIVPILRGRPNQYVRPELGYHSENAFEIELEIDSGFTLDGELFAAVPRVMLSGRQKAFFLRCGSG